MRAIVTCGPSHAPIDEVRRITNFSTGELGVLLCETLSRRGHEVVCLKGRGATFPGPRAPCEVRRFDTNNDVRAGLRQVASGRPPQVLFHVAALCDYEVGGVRSSEGSMPWRAKIPTNEGALVIELRPAAKVIAELRALFPNTRLVGWKYEVEGDRGSALAAAWRQIAECRTDACVVNGRAFGEGFGFCQPPDRVDEFGTKAILVEGLVDWLEGVRD